MGFQVPGQALVRRSSLRLSSTPTPNRASSSLPSTPSSTAGYMTPKKQFPSDGETDLVASLQSQNKQAMLKKYEIGGEDRVYIILETTS